MFEVGAIISKLKLDKSGWDASIKKIKDDQSGLAKFATKHSATMKTMGRGMTLLGGAVLAASGGMVKAFADFDEAMTESLAIMGDVSPKLRKQMADTAKEMSEQSTYSAKELAAAYYYLASAGYDAEKSIAALPIVTRFAQAGAFDLATATDLLTDAQSALGLSVDDVVQNEENMIRVSDVLVKANTKSNASVQLFSESLTNMGAVAIRQANKEIEEGVAVLAAFADQGIKGRKAGMALEIVLRDMQKAARENSVAFEAAGVAVYDANGQINNMADIIGNLEDSLGSLSPEQKKASLAMMGFQEESLKYIQALMGMSDKIKDYETALKGAGNTTEEVYRKQLEGFNQRMKLLKNQVMSAAITLGENLMPAIESLARGVSKTVKHVSDWVKENPKLASTIVNVTARLGPLLLLFGAILMKLPKIIAGIKALRDLSIGTRLQLQLLALKTTTVSLKGVLSKLPLIAAAAFVGWKIGRLIGELTGLDKVTQKFFDRIFQGKELLNTEFGPSVDGAAKAMVKLKDTYKVTTPELNKLKEKYGDYVKVLDAVEDGTEVLTKRKKALTRETEEEKEAADDLKETVEDQRNAYEDLIEKQEETTTAREAEEEAERKLREEAERWKSLMDTLRGVTIPDKRKRIQELEKAIKTLDEEYEAGIITLDQYKKGVKAAENEIKTIVASIEMTAVPAFRNLWDIVRQAPGAFKNAGKAKDDFSDNVKTKAEKIKEQWETTFASTGHSINEFISDMQDGVVAVEDFTEAIGDLAGDVFSIFSDVPVLGELFGDLLGGLIEGIVGFFEMGNEDLSWLDDFQKGLESLADSLKKLDLNADTWDEAWQIVNRYLETVDELALSSSNILELSDAFDVLLDGAKKLGLEGSKEIVDFILKMRELGVDIPSVTKYVQEQLDRIPAALSNLGMEAEDVGKLAVHSFNAMIASGVPFLEAIEKMSPALEDLKEKYAEQGLVADAALQRLFDMAQITEENKELFEALQANKEIMDALGNSGWMTQEAFTALAQDAYNIYNNLQAAGMTSEEALRAMAPNLQEIINNAAAYGLEIDEATQGLIDQAMALGIVTEAQETESDRAQRLNDEMIAAMKLGFEELADTIKEAFGKAFGIVFDDLESRSEAAANKFRGEWDDALGSISGELDGISDKARDMDFPTGPGDLSSGGGGGAMPSFQHGGYIPHRTIAQIGEIPEFVLNVPQVMGLINAVSGRDRQVNLHLELYNHFTINSLDPSTMQDVVRNQIEPELLNYLETNITKLDWQKTLEIE